MGGRVPTAKLPPRCGWSLILCTRNNLASDISYFLFVSMASNGNYFVVISTSTELVSNTSIQLNFPFVYFGWIWGSGHRVNELFLCVSFILLLFFLLLYFPFWFPVHHFMISILLQSPYLPYSPSWRQRLSQGDRIFLWPNVLLQFQLSAEYEFN